MSVSMLAAQSPYGYPGATYGGQASYAAPMQYHQPATYAAPQHVQVAQTYAAPAAPAFAGL